MAEVTLKNICKVYDSRERGHRGVLAVKDFTMDIRDEEFIVFVGPSGCGKSTTLRMIAGLEDISSGDLYIDGVYVNDVPAKDRNIAMVFQNYALYPHMTAYQNISFGLTLQRIREPIYEQSEDVANVLSEIAAARAQMRAECRSIAAAEKQIDALDKKNTAYLKAIDAVREKERRTKDRGIHLPEVQNAVQRLSARAEGLRAAIETNMQTAEELRAAIASGKERLDELEADICAKQESIKDRCLLRIDDKKLKELEKHKAYYLKLRAGDNAVREQDEAQLAKLEEELGSLLPEGEAAAVEWEGSEDAPATAEELRIAGLRELIGRYQEELDVLARRRESIDENLARIDGEREFYAATPQPAYRFRRYTKTEIDRKVMRAAEILDIKKLLKRKPREMSGGQRQRIALGRAIVREPKVFLLDEPLSNLDAKLRTSMRSEIVKLHKQLKTTFIYVTHDQVEAMTMGTRIVVMKDGEVQQIDTPVNLFDNPVNTFVAGFIGTPQMNMFRVQMRAVGTKVQFSFGNDSVLTCEKKKMRPVDERYLDGEPHDVVLGIRSENFFLSKDGSEFACTVSEVELLGSETNIYTTFNGANIILKLNYRPAVAEGDPIVVGVDAGKLYLFDAETTKTILKG